MEFKTTSTSRRRSSHAFTLVEVLIAVGLSGLLLAVCASLMLYTIRSIASVTDSVDLNARSRHAIDRMSKKLRQASVVKSFSATSLAVTYNNQALTYTYDPDLKTLVEDDAGTVATLLKDCEAFQFAYYKRNPVTNSFNQFPVLTATNEAKVVQVNWRCSRTLVGKVSGNAEMVSAKIVLRAK